MPSNAIALGIKPLEIDSPVDTFAKVAGVRNMLQQGQLHAQQQQMNEEKLKAERLANQQAEVAARGQQMLQSAYVKHAGDPDKTLAELVSGGADPGTVQGFEKHVLSLKEQKAKIAQSELPVRQANNATARGVIQQGMALPDDQYAAMAPQITQQLAAVIPGMKTDQPLTKEQLQHLGLAVNTDESLNKAEAERRAQVKATQDAAEEARKAAKAPIELQKLGSEAVSAEQKAAGTEPEQPHEKATREQSAAQALERNFLTRRGQNMTDARARELAQIARDTAAEVRDSKPPTSAQSTVATYAARAKRASETIDRMEQGFGERMFNKVIPDFASFLRTEKGQAFDQAQRDFINASLRRESGAVINKDEFKNAEQQYLPQPGDSVAILKQKRENRQIQMESFKRAAGKAYEDPDVLIKAAGGGAVIEWTRDKSGKPIPK